MYLTIVEESAKNFLKRSFFIGGKFTVNDIIFAVISNFILTSDGIGIFLQNFKALEPSKIEKWLIHP